MLRRLHFVLLLVILAGCSTVPTPQHRLANAESLAASRGWTQKQLDTEPFALVAFVPEAHRDAARLSIYIEGDGLAWSSRSTVSDDPTPGNPVALRLALTHPDGNAAYLGRPCQYARARQSQCAQRYWTDARFSPEVIDSTSMAIDALKRRFGAQRLELVGYSGGGAVALLVAARRSDVARVITVAGNLDPDAWALHHRLSHLSGSLNPTDEADRLTGLPQNHFVGSRDQVIPPDLAQQWPEAIAGVRGDNLRIVPGFDHACCWAEKWSALHPGPF